MKILHLITSLRTGGAEKLMVDLLPRLRDKGVEVDLCLHDGIDTPFRKELESKGIKVFDLGVGGSVYSPAKFLKLLPHLKNYDIIHTHNTASQLFGASGAFLTGIKAVTTEHNTSNRRRSKKYLKPVDKWMYNRYKIVINISQKAEDNLLDYLGKTKAKVLTVNNGIDISKIQKAEPSSLFEEIATGSRKIIMVAAFRWEKDQPTLIRTMKLLPEKFHLFLVGDGTRREEYENLIKELDLGDRVHLLGLRTDVPNLLKATDYVVMSSHFEGLSLSSVEGMAAGKPMIASNVDGLHEVVEGAGILFEHENAEELAQKILDLDQNPEKYNSVAEACKSRSRDFHIMKMVENYFEEYIGL